MNEKDAQSPIPPQSQPEAPPPPTPEPLDPTALEFKGSSNVRTARLDQATGIVTVSFANESSYRYGSFTIETMREWAEAKSAGTWFHQHVRQHPEKHPQIGPDGLPIKVAGPAPVQAKPTAPPAAAATPPPAAVKPATPAALPEVVPEPPADQHAGKKRTAARIARARDRLNGRSV